MQTPPQLFVMKPCKTSAAYSITPKKPVKLDLRKVKEMFGKVLADAPFLVIVLKGSAQITVYNSGKILIKDAGSEEKARKLAEEIYAIAR